MDAKELFSMINLKIRTEYSFRKAYGRLDDIIKNVKGNAIGIADFGTWGWVKFKAECEKNNIKPIFGLEFAVVLNAEEKTKQPTNYMTMIAKNLKGIQTPKIYKGFSHSYYKYPMILNEKIKKKEVGLKKH